MFKPRTDVNTKIESIFDAPKVYISTNAYAQMTHIVDICDKEVGWLGTAQWIKNNNIITIDDIFIFHQEVNSATCEITPEGLTLFAEELLQDRNGIDIWNNITLWGHSHVRMGVTPSGQDDNQMKVFADHNDWFLRIIANKSGELKVDLFDYKANISYIDLKWDILIPELFSTKEFIEQEIKNKVKEKKYTPTNIYGYGYSYHKPIHSLNIKDEEYEDEYEREYEKTKKSTQINSYCSAETLFTEGEIIEIVESQSKESAIKIIEDILGNTFTQYELDQLYGDCVDQYMDVIFEDYSINTKGSEE